MTLQGAAIGHTVHRSVDMSLLSQLLDTQYTGVLICHCYHAGSLPVACKQEALPMERPTEPIHARSSTGSGYTWRFSSRLNLHTEITHVTESVVCCDSAVIGCVKKNKQTVLDAA